MPYSAKGGRCHRVGPLDVIQLTPGQRDRAPRPENRVPATRSVWWSPSRPPTGWWSLCRYWPCSARRWGCGPSSAKGRSPNRQASHRGPPAVNWLTGTTSSPPPQSSPDRCHGAAADAPIEGGSTVDDGAGPGRAIFYSIFTRRDPASAEGTIPPSAPSHLAQHRPLPAHLSTTQCHSSTPPVLPHQPDPAHPTFP